MTFEYELGDAVEIVDGPLKGKFGNVLGRTSSLGPGGVLERYNVDVVDVPIQGATTLLSVDSSELKYVGNAKVTQALINKTLSMPIPQPAAPYHYKVYRGIESVPVTVTVSDSKPCACDSRDLMHYGCKCGAFKRGG